MSQEMHCDCGAVTDGKCPTCKTKPLCDECKKEYKECVDCAGLPEPDDDDDFDDDDDDDGDV